MRQMYKVWSVQDLLATSFDYFGSAVFELGSLEYMARILTIAQ